MKKNLLLITILGLYSMGLQAQIKVEGGFRFGLNLADIRNQVGDSKEDFYFGGLVHMRLTKWYALQPEIVYSRQGGKIEYAVNDAGGPIDTSMQTMIKKQTLDVNYLSFGLINKFYVVPNAGFHIMVGPVLDYKINDNADFDIDKYDVGGTLGMGYTFPFGMSMEFRYKHGFNVIYGDSGWVFSGDSKFNRVLQLGLGFQF
ncbi:MAG: PorT family protein [Flavobacteriaceae bacterium]|nr:PorT family protein [Flavobacteriaceae bacterium]